MAERRSSFGTPDGDDFLHRIGSIRRWARNGNRAPHKPLMLLYALGRLKEGQSRIDFRSAEATLAPLLRLYAPPVANVVVGNPFLRLKTDGFWSVEGAPATEPGFPRDGTLRRANPVAGFDAATLAVLRDDPHLIDRAARQLLDANFPPSVHEDLLSTIGLDPAVPPTRPGLREEAPRAARDPAFRGRVLDAYLHRCALCGFSLRHRDGLIGVDAAHIRWHAFEGPDTVDNGLALCALHHRLFDLGVVTLDDALSVRVASGVNGDSARDLLTSLASRPMERPVRPEDRPSPEFLNWHRRQVFRAEAL